MARSTSIAVYRQIEEEGLLSKRRLEAYQWLFHNGPATAAEVEHGLGNTHAHKRLPELRRQAVVDEVGLRICAVTGHEVIGWDVTDALPVELEIPPAKMTRKQLVARVYELEGDVRELADKLSKVKAVARKYKAQAAQLRLF